jgi:hypothetical protein
VGQGSASSDSLSPMASVASEALSPEWRRRSMRKWASAVGAWHRRDGHGVDLPEPGLGNRAPVPQVDGVGRLSHTDRRHPVVDGSVEAGRDLGQERLE